MGRKSIARAASKLPVAVRRIEHSIIFIRDHRVILDSELALMYGVSTSALLQAVRRNIARFPADFMFQLNEFESAALRSQIVISKKRGGRRYHPYAFTEQGVAMLSSVLRSARAVSVNVEIMRAFVRLRQLLATNEQLQRKLDQIEAKLEQHDQQIGAVFDAIRQLIEKENPPGEPRKPRIGFDTEEQLRGKAQAKLTRKSVSRS